VRPRAIGNQDPGSDGLHHWWGLIGVGPFLRLERIASSISCTSIDSEQFFEVP
jgi:hypothetical protein